MVVSYTRQCNVTDGGAPVACNAPSHPPGVLLKFYRCILGLCSHQAWLQFCPVRPSNFPHLVSACPSAFAHLRLSVCVWIPDLLSCIVFSGTVSCKQIGIGCTPLFLYPSIPISLPLSVTCSHSIGTKALLGMAWHHLTMFPSSCFRWFKLRIFFSFLVTFLFCWLTGFQKHILHKEKGWPQFPKPQRLAQWVSRRIAKPLIHCTKTVSRLCGTWGLFQQSTRGEGFFF